MDVAFRGKRQEKKLGLIENYIEENDSHLHERLAFITESQKEFLNNISKKWIDCTNLFEIITKNES